MLAPEYADRATMDGRCTIDGKFFVPYEYRVRFQLWLNQSFILFVKAFSTVQSYFRPGMAREKFRGKRRQEFLMCRLLARFFHDERGATALEYCIIAAGLSIVIVGAVNGIGSSLSTIFTSVSTSLK